MLCATSLFLRAQRAKTRSSFRVAAACRPGGRWAAGRSRVMPGGMKVHCHSLLQALMRKAPVHSTGVR